MAKNQSYPVLEKRIADTYVQTSNATLSKSVYDSYIKAYRWASDRINAKTGGIIAFVSSAGWIDGNAMDGFRKCLEQEFNSIYVFNLRGNQRTSGETSRREGGKVFGSDSRTPIAITLLIKKPNHDGKATIRYRDIGDYLSSEEKLEIVAKSHNVLHNTVEWQTIQPNEHADWLNQRNNAFGDFIPLGIKGKKDQCVFSIYSGGVLTSRDSWCYNFSKTRLKQNISASIDYYNEQRIAFNNAKQSGDKKDITKHIDTDKKKISWSRAIIANAKNNKPKKYLAGNVFDSLFRPYCAQNLYYSRDFNEMTYQMPKLFPTVDHGNLVITTRANRNELPLIVNKVPDFHFNGDSQCFSLFYYDKKQIQQNTLFDNTSDQYIRRDALTNFILDRCRENYGPKVTKEDIFYYVYGLLHSQDYRTQFAADLKKMLPRLPLVEKPADFWAFSKAGRALAELHLNYEEQPPCPAVKVTGAENGKFQVEKMRFPNKGDKAVIDYNPWIRLSGMPLEAYEYVVNGRSAIEWIMERYQVKVDKDSGIKNDPNDWAAEHGQPRYILDLLLSIVTVSLETMKIVNSLPQIVFDDNDQRNNGPLGGRGGAQSSGRYQNSREGLREMSEWNLFGQQPLTMNHFHYGRDIPLAAVCEYDKGIVFYPGEACVDPYPSGHASYPMEGSKPVFRNGAWYIRDEDHEGQEIEFTLPTRETMAWWEEHKDKIWPLAKFAEVAHRSWDNYGEDPEDGEESDE